MKKCLTLLLALAFVLVLAACGKTGDTSEPSASGGTMPIGTFCGLQPDTPSTSTAGEPDPSAGTDSTAPTETAPTELPIIGPGSEDGETGIIPADDPKPTTNPVQPGTDPAPTEPTPPTAPPDLPTSPEEAEGGVWVDEDGVIHFPPVPAG